jgi:hypothetical protein
LLCGKEAKTAVRKVFYDKATQDAQVISPQFLRACLAPCLSVFTADSPPRFVMKILVCRWHTRIFIPCLSKNHLANHPKIGTEQQCRQLSRRSAGGATDRPVYGRSATT